MENKKTIIDIKGIIVKVNKEEFTEQEYEQLISDFYGIMRAKDCMFGGGFEHCSANEYLKNN